ncbi:MAG: 2'-5' RNA ligase family protein [Cyclobacteriaceae bacterium]|jgi:2'-5' RNA ligase|nr:2'-5' RNA ligase family protein [Cyclobacteriaceae bacterium]
MKNLYINHHFFTIIPSPPIQAFVSNLKKQVRSIIGHGFESEFSKAHISLFQYNEHHTDAILYDANWLLPALLPLDIYVNGLGIFKHGTNKTIYLQIDYKTPIADLAKALGGKDITPHITIARNLPADDFDKAWKHLQSISYRNYFRCNSVTVLKREHNRWNEYLELPLSQNSSTRSVSLLAETLKFQL